MKCRVCNHHEFHRARRHGFWQKRVLPLLGIYPWRCAACGKARLLRGRHESESSETHRTPVGRSAA